MTRTIYDKKCVYVQPVVVADLMTDLTNDPTVNQLLVQGDIVVDTKGELATFQTLNCTHYADESNIVIRKQGTIKFSKNLTASFFANHNEMAQAGIGAMLMDTPFVEIPKNTGFPCTIAKTTGIVTLTGTGAATNHGLLAEGQLVFIPGFGLRSIAIMSASPNFTLDTKIDTDFLTGSILPLETFNIADPSGNKTYIFNVLIKNDDGDYIVAYGCGCDIQFEVTQDKQCLMSVTFTSPDMRLVARAAVEAGSPLTLSNVTDETEGLPIIWDFDNSYVNTEAGVETSYFPQVLTLGRSITVEPLKSVGGRNNIRGYLNRSAFKCAMKFDCDTVGKALIASPRTVAGWSFYSVSQGIGLYFSRTQLGQIDYTSANAKHDSYSVSVDINHMADSKVLLGIVK